MGTVSVVDDASLGQRVIHGAVLIAGSGDREYVIRTVMSTCSGGMP